MKIQLSVLGLVAALGLMGSIAHAQEGLTLEAVIERLDESIARSDGAGSTADVLEAAAGLGFVLERDGIESASGQLALGNAYFIGDDLGRAIVAYRRGLLIDPGNEQIVENLEHARSFVEPRVPGEGEGWTVRAVVLSWRGLVDRWVVWVGSAMCVGLASCFVSAGLAGWRRVLPRVVVIGLGAVGIVGFGVLGFDWWEAANDRGVVVVDGGTGLYSGPGAGVYPLVYEGSLGIGSEGELLEERDGWSRVVLGNGQEGWVEGGSIVPVVRVE